MPLDAAERSGWTHHERVLNNVRLHYVEHGEGPPVVLLHGFPDFWYGWRLQLPALAESGFRAIAPDLRGYGRSEKPAGVHSYRVEALLEDLRALIRHTADGRAVVIGHDWGGVLAWHFAMAHPEATEKLVILNAPHPAAFRRELHDPTQLLRSSYVALFQVPWLPEALLRANDFALLEQALRRSTTRRDAFTERDLELYRAEWSRPRALTSALNYYRAFVRYGSGRDAHDERITRSTLLLWGERDPALGVGLSEGLDQWIPDLRTERFPDAGHWVMLDAPEQVNRSLLRFLEHG